MTLEQLQSRYCETQIIKKYLQERIKETHPVVSELFYEREIYLLNQEQNELKKQIKSNGGLSFSLR